MSNSASNIKRPLLCLNLLKAGLFGLFLLIVGSCSDHNTPSTAPIIQILSNPPAEVTAPYQVEIDASDSIDEDGDKLSFIWTLNGEFYSSEPIFSAELDEGVHLIELSVSDGDHLVEQSFKISAHNVQSCLDQDIYGARQLRLLTATAYQNTLEDLVGINFSVLERLPTDDIIEDFYNNMSIVPNQSHINTYLTLADEISTWSKENNFNGVVSCDTTLVTCQETFVREFGAKAFRRPLKEAEVVRMLSLLDDPRLMNNDNQEGIRLLMMGFLSAQSFLFRSEMGELENDPGFQSVISYENLDTTYENLDANFTLNSDEPEWYVRASWTSDKALIEIEGIPTANADGVWPVVQFKNSNFSYELNYELSGDAQQPFQAYITERVLSGTRYFSMSLVNPDNGAEFDIQSVRISQADQVITQVYPEPEPDALFILTPYEMATYLAYNFTGSMPDEQLMQDAANNQLETPSQIKAQIDRLLDTPRGQKQLAYFADQWLGTNAIANGSITSKDPNLFPEFTQDIRDALAQEVREMFKQNVLTDAPFSEFFDSRTVFANDVLAQFYELTDSGNAEFTQMMAPEQRGGLLTTGAFLGTNAHPDYTAPILRAVRIREKLMCQYLPDPPNDLDLERSESTESLSADWAAGHLTSRQYFSQLTDSIACLGCHEKWINPLGFALEDYNAIGQFQSSDHNELSINSNGFWQGEHSFLDEDVTLLNGAKSVSAFLAASTRTDYCVTEKIFRFMNATGPDTITRREDENVGQLSETEKNDYACLVQHTAANLSDTQNLKDVFKSLGISNMVRYRKERN